MQSAFKKLLFAGVVLLLCAPAKGQLLDASLIEAPLALRAPRYETIIPTYYSSQSDRFFIDVVRLFIELGMVVDTTQNGITARDADRYFAFSLQGRTLVLSGTYAAEGVPVDTTLYFVRDGVLYLDLETLTSAYEDFIDFSREKLEISVASGASFRRLDYLLERGRLAEERAPLRYPRQRKFLGTPAFNYALNWFRFEQSEALYATIGGAGEVLFGRFEGSGTLTDGTFRPLYYSWDLDFDAPLLGYTRLGVAYGPSPYGYALPEALQPSYLPFYNTFFVKLSNEPITPDQVQGRRTFTGQAEPGSVVAAHVEGEQTDYIKVGKDGRYRLLVPVRYGLSTVRVEEHRLGGLPPVLTEKTFFTPDWFVPAGRVRYLLMVSPEDRENFYFRAAWNSGGNLNLMVQAQGREQALAHVGIRVLPTAVIGGGYGVSWPSGADRPRPIYAATLDWWSRHLMLQMGRSQRYLFSDALQTTTQLQGSIYLGPLSLFGSYRLNETSDYGRSDQYFLQGSLRLLGLSLNGSYNYWQTGSLHTRSRQLSVFRSFTAWRTPFFLTANARRYDGLYNGVEYEAMLQMGTPPALRLKGKWDMQIAVGVRHRDDTWYPTLQATLRLPFASASYNESSQMWGRSQQISVYGGGYMGLLPTLTSNPVHSAAIEILVFEDVNRNGRLDGEDVLRPDVSLTIMGASVRRNGSTFLAEQLIPGQSYLVEINPASISDPYLTPATDWRFRVVAPTVGLRRIAVPLVRKTLVFGHVMKVQPLRYEVHIFQGDRMVERTEIFSDGSYTVLLSEGQYTARLYDRVAGRYEAAEVALAVKGEEMTQDLYFLTGNQQQ